MCHNRGVDPVISPNFIEPFGNFHLVSKHCLDDHVLPVIMAPLLLCHIGLCLIEFLLLC